MKNFLCLISIAVLPATSQAATVEFSVSTSPVSAEAEAAGAPAGGTIFDYFVTTDADILSVDQVLVDVSGGSFFQVPPPFGSDTVAPDAAFLNLNRALEADSWITTPGSTNLLGPGLDMTDGTSTFGDLSNDGPQTDFHFARFGMPPDATGTFSARVTVAGASGPESFPLSVDLEVVPDVLVPSLPDGSTISFSACLRGITDFPSAISFAGTGTLTSVSVSSTLPDLIGARIDGLNIDLSVDAAVANILPIGVVVDATVLVETTAGGFSYGLNYFCPEPTTLALAVVCVLGVSIRPAKPFGFGKEIS